MSKTFKCPNCGAPLDYDGGPDTTMECPYCKGSVIVPEELRGGQVYAVSLGLGEITRLAGPLREIARLARSGKKIEAVKLYRQTFNGGLQEAKDAVDKIERGEPVTMTDVTVEHIAVGEPVVVTDVAETLASVRAGKGGDQAKRAVPPLVTAITGAPGAIIFILGCLVGFAFLFYAVGILPLRLNPVYRAAMELVKNDPAVIELFGSPVRDSLFVGGTVKGSGGSESATLQVAISGPRARGTAHIWGEKERGGTVRVHSIWIEIGGEEVLEYRESEAEKGFQISPSAPPTYLPPTPVPSPTPPTE